MVASRALAIDVTYRQAGCDFDLGCAAKPSGGAVTLGICTSNAVVSGAQKRLRAFKIGLGSNGEF